MNPTRRANLWLGTILMLAAGTSWAASPIEQLDWLAGRWALSEGANWSEETWTAPRGGLMLGVNRSGEADAATAFEFLRIAADADGSVVYWAAPGGAAPTPFRLSTQSEHRVVFENPGHDFPTRIEYRRDGDVLVATISGKDGANAMSWRWQRQD